MLEMLANLQLILTNLDPSIDMPKYKAESRSIALEISAHSSMEINWQTGVGGDVEVLQMKDPHILMK